MGSVLVAKGIQIGVALVALVFLMAGPATNLATLGAIYRNLGRRTLVTYLITLIIGSLDFAYLLDAVLGWQALVDLSLVLIGFSCAKIDTATNESAEPSSPDSSTITQREYQICLRMIRQLIERPEWMDDEPQASEISQAISKLRRTIRKHKRQKLKIAEANSNTELLATPLATHLSDGDMSTQAAQATASSPLST